MNKLIIERNHWHYNNLRFLASKSVRTCHSLYSDERKHTESVLKKYKIWTFDIRIILKQ